MVDLAGARVVAILTRAPSAGGKRRLFEALGRPVDSSLLAALLLDTLDAVARSTFPVVIVVEPADACAEVEGLTGMPVIPQAPGTLGDRMRAAMAALFARGAAAVALVGSDLPDVDPDAIERAFALVDGEPSALVLGPAVDGGYYLVAAASVPPVFDGITWGTPLVLEETCAAAMSAGVPVRLVAAAADVDGPDDLRAVRARRTRAWVAAHL